MDPMLSDSQQKFHKVIEVVRSDLATIRTGKASPALIENVAADAYGTKMKLLELATIVASDTTTLSVTPFDAGNTAGIMKAITDANLGLSAVQDGNAIRVMVPALSQERREEYVKLAKNKGEGGKVMVRQIRHEAMEEVGKLETDEDTKKRLEKEVQKMTDESVERIDAMISEKESELMKM